MLQISSRDAQIERTLKIGQRLLRWPLRNQDFARQAVQAFLELYQSAKAEGDFQLMELACRCLQLGWVRTPSGSPRHFRDRRLSTRPCLAYRAVPEVGQMFYQAYLGVIEDPEYHEIKARHKAFNWVSPWPLSGPGLGNPRGQCRKPV